jgi:hypothetical protein
MEVTDLMREAMRDYELYKNEPGFIFPDVRREFSGDPVDLASFAANLDMRFVNVVNQARADMSSIYWRALGSTTGSLQHLCSPSATSS